MTILSLLKIVAIVMNVIGKLRIERELYRESRRIPHYKYPLTCTLFRTRKIYAIELNPLIDACDYSPTLRKPTVEIHPFSRTILLGEPPLEIGDFFG